MSTRLTPTALAWYESESDYKTVMSMIPSEESAIAAEYPQYIRNIQHFEQSLPAKGFFPMRVKIKPEAIQAWAAANHKRLDRAGIVEFATTHMGGGDN